MADRLSLRLLDLPPALVAELAAKAFTRCPDLWSEAEAALAIRSPVPAIVTEVLLSPDLLQLVMAVLPVASKSAALVCTTWRHAWQTTAPLRGLCPADLPQPDFPIGQISCLTALSEERLCISHRPDRNMAWHTVVDSSMRKLYDIHLNTAFDCITMATQSTFYAWSTGGGNALCRYQLNDDASTVELARNNAVRPEADCSYVYSVTPAPGGLLFASVFGDELGDESGDEQIIALDALSLEFRFQFGSEFLCDVRDSVVVGDELFVGDRFDKRDENGEIYDRCYGRIQVFSMTGQHLREIRSAEDKDWGDVSNLQYLSGRIYFTDYVYGPKHLSCVVVLTPEGQQLQTLVLASQDSPTHYMNHMCVFDDLLIWSNMKDVHDYEMIAVKRI